MTSREKFEAWMTDEQWFHGSDFEWDERRNCYAQFGIHLAYKAFLAAEGAAEKKLTDMAVQLANAESKCRELAAENAAMKQNAVQAEKVIMSSKFDYWSDRVELSAVVGRIIETPATDAFLAEVRAQAHKEGAHFVANRMLAAWDAGFIDDTAKNAADIARMILTSTEFMADASEGDFDRSFADGVLEDIAAQIRKGAAL